MQLSKADLVDGISRLGGRLKKGVTATREKMKETTGVVITGLGAGAIGALIGMMKGRPDYDPEKGVTLWGADIDLLAGAVFTLGGLAFTKQLGKRNAEYAKWAGGGMLAYWFGTYMEDKMLERAENANAPGQLPGA